MFSMDGIFMLPEHFSIGVLLSVFGMLAAAYVMVVAAVMVNEKLCSQEINHKLAEMKKHNKSQNR